MSAARILVIDDEADIRELVKEILSDEGYEVEVAGNAAQARALRAQQHPELILLDIWMPDVDGITLLREWTGPTADGCPIVMMSGHGTVETAVEATRLGAVDFIEKPLSLAKLLRVVERALEGARTRRSAGRAGLGPVTAPVGKSRVIQQLRAELETVAAGGIPVMLVGEHGTGREAFGRFLHDRSPRASRPFVTVVASTLRDADVEQRLLGRGGVLDTADDGTVFLSEVGDLPPAAQRILLGVLETGVYAAPGESASRALRARLVSSAQPDVERRADGTGAVSAPGIVRRDLLGHLNAQTIRVPSLREYAEDVPDLLRHYVDRLVDAEGLRFRRFGVAAQNRLRNYPWPGNLQELRNFVRRMLMQPGADDITLEEIDQELAHATPPAETLVKQDLLALSLRQAREHFERAYLQQQLLLCHGKVGQLAKRVGMERTHLYRKLRSLGIDFRSVPDDADG